MNNNINLIAFGTFGNPNGFTQTFFAGDPNIQNSVKAFDIRGGGIMIYPNSTVYSIRKEYKDKYSMISYAIYTYAQEPTSARGGSFIGSSILFVDKTADEKIIISNLNEFHQNLVDKNVQNDIIKVNHSNKFDVSKSKPKDFDKINFHLREIDNLNFEQNSNKHLVVYCETNQSKLQTYFKNSIDLLNVYDTIYFTSSKEVAEYVLKKGIFPLIQNVGNRKEFENEIKKLTEERKRKNQEAINELEREKQNLENERKKTYDESKNQIEENKKQQLQNQQIINDSEKELNKINEYYNSFLRQLDELLNQLKAGIKKPDEVKQIHNENKRIFRGSIESLKAPNYINSLSKPKPTTTIRETTQRKHNWNYEYDYGEKEKEDKLDFFKITTLVLSVLWLGTLAYILILNGKSEPDKESQREQSVTEEQSVTQDQSVTQESEVNSTSKLNPLPNEKLSKEDYILVAKKINYNTEVKEIVEVILKNNPTDINRFYEWQKDDYAKLLIEKNIDCFKDSIGTSFFVKDTLRHIPSYKPDK